MHQFQLIKKNNIKYTRPFYQKEIKDKNKRYNIFNPAFSLTISLKIGKKY